MKTREIYISGARNFAVVALFGHVGGAVLVGALGALAAPYFALLGALFGAAALGGTGVALGLVLLPFGRPAPGEDDPAVSNRPWFAIAAGAVASTVVATVTLVAHSQGGFLDGSPCPIVVDGLGAHSGTIDTLIPAQFTCLYPGGALPLVPPPTLAALALLALAGAAALLWGLWRLRRAGQRPDTVIVVLACAVAFFLAVDGVLGAIALAAPAGFGS